MRELARRGASDFSAWSGFRPRFGDFESWFGDLDRLFAGAVPRVDLAPSHAPQLVMHRTEEGYRITADLPGFSEGDVKLDVHNGVLTLSGERTTGNWQDHTAVRRERSSMKFSASIRLPEDADAGNVTGKLAHGVLTITAAQRPEVKPRQIKITAT